MREREKGRQREEEKEEAHCVQGGVGASRMQTNSTTTDSSQKYVIKRDMVCVNIDSGGRKREMEMERERS